MCAIIIIIIYININNPLTRNYLEMFVLLKFCVKRIYSIIFGNRKQSLCFFLNFLFMFFDVDAHQIHIFLMALFLEYLIMAVRRILQFEILQII